MKFKENEYIWKLKKFSKHFLSTFKGISENRAFVYNNNYTDTLTSTKIPSVYFDKAFRNKFRSIQENQFHIYNFDEIEPKKVENGDNYQWKMLIKFSII